MATANAVTLGVRWARLPRPFVKVDRLGSSRPDGDRARTAFGTTSPSSCVLCITGKAQEPRTGQP